MQPGRSAIGTPAVSPRRRVACRRRRRQGHHRGRRGTCVAEWITTSQPRSSGLQVHRRRGGGVADDARGVGRAGFEVRHREKRVRGSLDPDEVDPSRRRPSLIELDMADAPAGELLQHDSCSVVRALGESDRLSRRQQPEDHRGRRRGAGRKEKSLAAVQLAEPSFRFGHGRARVAGIRELARLAVFVRPRRRAVDRRRAHAFDSIAALAPTAPGSELRRFGADRCTAGGWMRNSRGPDDGHDTALDRHPRASHRLQACTTRTSGAQLGRDRPRRRANFASSL